MSMKNSDTIGNRSRDLPVCSTASEKLTKIPMFGPWISERPQSGVILTSFSAWGTKNSLAEINKSGAHGGDKRL
jgi:hypothetical protein